MTLKKWEGTVSWHKQQAVHRNVWTTRSRRGNGCRTRPRDNDDDDIGDNDDDDDDDDDGDTFQASPLECRESTNSLWNWNM
jgi:hypothetical protein